MIQGGVNLLEQTEEQERLLEASARELEKRKKKESKLKERSSTQKPRSRSSRRNTPTYRKRQQARQSYSRSLEAVSTDKGRGRHVFERW